MLTAESNIDINRNDLVDQLAHGLTHPNFQDLLLGVDIDGQVTCLRVSDAHMVHNQRWLARMDLQRFESQQDAAGEYPGTEAFAAWDYANWYINEQRATVEEMFGDSFVFPADGSVVELTLVD